MPSGKAWNHLFSPIYGYSRLGSLDLARQPIQENKNSEFKSSVPRLKIDWVKFLPMENVFGKHIK